jgi:pantoate--beta-alanine ligase
MDFNRVARQSAAMRVITSCGVMQRRALDWRASGVPVALVPTMGYLHAGHLSLVARARRVVGARGVVVASLFVNPTQFAPGEDLAAYPRDLQRDRSLCSEAGVDVLFIPRVADMYGEGEEASSTFVEEERLSRTMEGRSRPTHFRGVTTVVAKLFNLVLPDVAVFGAKDWQQAAVVRRMTRDLNFPVKLLVAPTVRDADGVALSSRNSYLTPTERVQARVLRQVLTEVRRRVRGSADGVAASRLRRLVEGRVAACPAARLDYVAFFEPRTLAPLDRVVKGAHMALAVFVGRTRLIDNERI